MSLFDKFWKKASVSDAASPDELLARAKQTGFEPFPASLASGPTAWMEKLHDAWCTCQGLTPPDRRGSDRQTLLNAIRDMLAPDQAFSRQMYVNLLAGYMLAAAEVNGSMGIMFCRRCLAPVFLGSHDGSAGLM